jgi:hypothetical protein
MEHVDIVLCGNERRESLPRGLNARFRNEKILGALADNFLVVA